MCAREERRDGSGICEAPDYIGVDEVGCWGGCEKKYEDGQVAGASEEGFGAVWEVFGEV